MGMGMSRIEKNALFLVIQDEAKHIWLVMRCGVALHGKFWNSKVEEPRSVADYLSDSNFSTEGEFPHMRFIQLMDSQRQCRGNKSIIIPNKRCHDRILRIAIGYFEKGRSKSHQQVLYFKNRLYVCSREKKTSAALLHENKTTFASLLFDFSTVKYISLITFLSSAAENYGDNSKEKFLF